MNTLKYTLLGFVQGFTEFLPISSSGHLIILKELLEIPQDIVLDTVLHLATLLAIIFYYRLYIKEIIKSLYIDFKKVFTEKNTYVSNFSLNSKLAFYILIATIPSAFFGLFFNNFFEESVRSVGVVIIMLTLISFYMLCDYYVTKKGKKEKKLTLFNTFVIGISQVIALIPGTSRSGVTITTGSLLGINKEQAANFSFLLSIPAVLGAFLLQLKDINSISYFFNINLLFAFTAASVTGYLCISLLIKLLKKYGFVPFIVYRLVLALLLTILLI